ncbi:MAG: hypothetical protein U9N59_13305 [Campylobacterota bacterium]|nr:hypothetical protein [Campylobacterota bacterium]
MIGKILGINEDGLGGVIRGEDGNRYKFTIEDIKNSSEPKVNDNVDFETDDKNAKEIYITKSNSIDMSAVSDKIKDIKIPKVNIPKDVKIPKFSIKNKMPLVAAVILIVIFAFSYYKNSKIEEKFVELLAQQDIYDIKYKDYGCSGLFTTDCYLENVQLFSNGALDFEAETLDITNISGLTEIATSNKLVEIPFSIEVDGIKVAEKFDNDLFKNFLTSKKTDWRGRTKRLSAQEQKEEGIKKALYDYVTSNLDSKTITLDAKLEVANKQVSSIEINELTYDNNVIPMIMDFKISNLDLKPTLTYFTLKVNGEKLFGFVYNTIKHFEKDKRFNDGMDEFSKKFKCVNEDEFTETAKKFITATIKSDKKMSDTYKTPLIDLFAHNAEGLRLNFENKNNYALDNLLLMFMMSGNLSSLEKKLKFELTSYGDKEDDIMPDYDSTKLAEFKKSVIDKISGKNKQELSELNSLKDKLSNFDSKQKTIDDEILNQHIKENLSRYKENILPQIEATHLAKEFTTTYNNNKYKKVVLNNKNYTLDNAFKKLKQIKSKAPAQYEGALNKVVEKFEPIGYNKDFLTSHLKSYIDKNQYSLRLRYSNNVANLYSKIDIKSSIESQMEKLYRLGRYNIPHELESLRNLINTYENAKNKNSKKSALLTEKRDLKNKKYNLERKLSSVNRQIDKVNYCETRACVEMINFNFLQPCS